MHYLEAGAGEPLLPIMGFGADHTARGVPDRRLVRQVSSLANPFRQSLTGFLRQGEAVVSHDTRARLPAIRCPTLVSVAEDDILLPSRFSREIVARIPGAELRVVPDAGHCYFLERADAFNELCLDFLAQPSSRKD